MSDKLLTDLRNQISTFGGSELDAVDNTPALRDMWEKMQELRTEMNEAKRKASEEAAKPYMELMSEIQRRYAFIIKLSS